MDPKLGPDRAVLVTHLDAEDVLELICIFGQHAPNWPFNTPGYVSINGDMYKVPGWLDLLIAQAYL